MGTIVEVNSEIKDPLPATGTMALDDAAKLRLEIEFDLSSAIGRATVTGNWLLLTVAMHRAVLALMGELGPRFTRAAAAARQQPAGTVQ